MLAQVIAILFPVFALVGIGFIVNKTLKLDFSSLNILNMAVFVPSLIFSALCRAPLGKDQGPLILAALCALFVPTLVVALISKGSLHFRTWAPAMTFRNSGNLAIPLFGYAFGSVASEAAILLFVVSTCVHVLFGGLVLNPNRGLSSLVSLCKMPLFIAAVVAMTVNIANLPIYSPLLQATELLGQAAIPIMLLSLGSQMTKLRLHGLTIGLQSVGLSLASGALAYLIIVLFIPLPLLHQQMMVLFCMLPPAVMNYLYAVQFNTEPDKVAAMVLFGNASAIISLPLLLSYAFSLT